YVAVDQGEYPVHVTGRQSMFEGFVEAAMPLEPGCSPPVQQRHLRSVALCQGVAQEIHEQVMKAKPLMLFIQRCDKEIRMFELVEHTGSITRRGIPCQYCLTQWAGEDI